MSQFIKQGILQSVRHEEFDKSNYQENGELDRTEDLIELDLEYLAEFHELHNDYPRLPEPVPIDISKESEAQGDIAHTTTSPEPRRTASSSTGR